MKKAILSIFCLLCCLICGVVYVTESSLQVLFQPDLAQIRTDAELDSNANGSSLYTSFEKFTYDPEEKINVTFILESESNISAISYQS